MVAQSVNFITTIVFSDYAKWTFCSKSNGCAIHKLHRTNYSYDYSKWIPSTTSTPKKNLLFSRSKRPLTLLIKNKTNSKLCFNVIFLGI